MEIRTAGSDIRRAKMYTIGKNKQKHEINYLSPSENVELIEHFLLTLFVV